MASSNDKGKRPVRGMGILIVAVLIGAVVAIALWMRDPPPGVNPSSGNVGSTIPVAAATRGFPFSIL